MKKFKKILVAFTLTLLISVIGVVLVSCSAKTVTYTFNTNGGAAISKVELDIGEEYDLPTPTKDGYSFEGWYLTEDYSGNAVTTVVAESSQTFYAKWERLYEISLNLDGGNLSVSTLYLKAGENVYNFMQDYTPTKSGYQFGAWFNGESELAKNMKMTEANITLTAKYKIAYNIEIWSQNQDLNGYEKTDVITYYEYVGKTVVAQESLDGFSEITNDKCVLTKTLTNNASDNVLVQYFNRETYNVIFNSNYPDGEKNTTQTVTATYGLGVEVPSELTYEGYCLIGWSTSANGSVVCKANYVENALYGNGEVPEAEKYYPSRNTTLYAVWVKGYSDMFGNADYLFLLDETSDVIYLSRGGVLFQGKYDSETKEFKFIVSDDLVRIGYLTDYGKFIYRDMSRSSSSTLYVNGVGLDENTKIYLDAFNGITYSVLNENGATESEGTYIIDEYGYYIATFTSGDLEGQELTMILTTLSDDAQTPVFLVRGEEFDLGYLSRFIVYSDGNQVGLVDYSKYYNYGYLFLDGFGNAYLYTGSSYEYYYYSLNDDIISLYYSSGTYAGYSAGNFSVVNVNGTVGYMPYDSSLAQSFVLDNGDILTLDGIYNATYVKGGTVISGYFYDTYLESAFGGYLISFVSNTYNYTFIVNITVNEDESYSFVAEEKNVGYAEYHYYDANLSNSSSYMYHYAPLLVVEEPASGTVPGTMIMYGYSTSGTYEKVSKGSYVYDSASGAYVYTAEEYFDAVDIAEIPVDLNNLQSFVFVLDSEATGYYINYWYLSTDKEGNVTNYDVINYTPANGGNATLTLVAGLAIYSVDGNVYSGKYTIGDDGSMVITTTSGYVYIELNLENKTFAALEHAPYNAYVVKENGYYTLPDEYFSYEYFTFDGKGGVVYTLITPAENEDEDDIVATYSGTIVKTDKVTDSGYYVYSFTCEDKIFEFIQFVSNSTYFVSLYNENVNGTYNSEDGILKLDGFSFYATFIDSDGNEYTGMYSVYSENVIRMIIDDNYRYFDLLGDRLFTLRGIEYGTYILMDNRYFDGTYVSLDGYGNAKVFTYDNSQDESKIIYLDEEAKYVQYGDLFTVSYTIDGNKTTLVGELGLYTYGDYDYNVFIINHDEVIKVYVNEEDWSLLILDGVGNAIKHNEFGEIEYGYYTLITDTILYYVNQAGDDACIYNYSIENGTAIPKTFRDQKYYTSELDSLIFSRYGFVIVNGISTYYYDIVNGEAVIYRDGEAGEDVNKYGFVEVVFGSYDDVKTYDGKTYYINDSYAITFTRNTDTSSKYPVLLNSSDTQKYPLENLLFTPYGYNQEYIVSGSVYINGEAFSCYVARELNEEDNPVFYILVGSYRFDIAVNYTGGNSCTYEVIGMSYNLTLTSYSYYSNIFITYLMTGTFDNYYGYVTVEATFNENGEMVTDYISGYFSLLSGMYDLEDNLITFENAEYTYSNGIYKVSIVGKDGNNYNAYFYSYYDSNYGYTYMLYALTLVQTVESDDYTLTVESLVATEASFSVGSIMGISLTIGEETVKADEILIKGNQLRFIVRTTAENGKITATTHYIIDLTAEGSDEASSNKVVTIYSDMDVAVETGKVIYNETGLAFVEFDQNGNPLLINLADGSLYLVSSSEVDEETGIITVKTTTEGISFTIEIDEENDVLKLAYATEEEENSEEETEDSKQV